MAQYFLLFTFFILSVSQTSGPYQMVIIFGSPQNFVNYTVENLNFASCLDYCITLDTCMAVYSEQDGDDCQIFEWGQLASVTETDESGGGKVGIRMNSTNSTRCPLNPEQNSMTNSGVSMPQYSITIHSGVWTFPPIPVCPTNFTMFNRTGGYWCITMVRSPQFITQLQAVSECSSVYGGILSGLENEDEFNTIADLAPPYIQQNYDQVSPYGVVAFWINGLRNDSCKDIKVRVPACNGTNEFTFDDPTLSDDPTGYLWGDQQPSGWNVNNSNCIMNRFYTSTYLPYGCDDYTCEVTGSPHNTAVFIGYVCGKVATWLS